MVGRVHQVIYTDEVQAPAAPTMPNLITQQTHTYLTKLIRRWDDAVDSQRRAWRDSCSGTGAGAWLMAPTHPGHLMETHRVLLKQFISALKGSNELQGNGGIRAFQ
eukprot:3789114-Amphidinium_carterae.1